MLNLVLISVSHWLFANEYLRLALKFPIILGQLHEFQIQARMKRNIIIVIVVNIIFYVQICTWTTLWMIYGFDMIELYDFSSVNVMTPAVVLIFAISKIKSRINELNMKELMAREALIWIHTWIFALYILMSLGHHLCVHASYRAIFSEKENAINMQCRL